MTSLRTHYPNSLTDIYAVVFKIQPIVAGALSRDAALQQTSNRIITIISNIGHYNKWKM